MTLIEIVVVVAIMGLIAAVALPSLAGLLDLQQRAGAKELAQTYTWLVDEAALRNATFRIAFDLDQGSWKVEVGDPGTVVFSTPEEREEYDEALRDKMKRFTKRELEEGAAADIEDATGRFEGLTDPSFTTSQKLPYGTAFAWVWTPQYGEDGVRPDPDFKADELEEGETGRIAYSYIFSDGTAEHTVIRIVGEDDPDDGYTVEVEPISGRVHLHSDLVEPSESMAWLPDEGPSLR